MFLVDLPKELNPGIIEKFIAKAQDWIVDYGPKIIVAILIYFIGNWVIKWIMTFLNKAFSVREFDPSLKTFMLSLVKAALLIAMFLMIAGTLGINMTGFAALLAGAGLAIGAALNGSLGNIAGGVMLMIFKPFKVGDIIEAQGNTGTVREMGIMSTTIVTSDNKTVYLPNGGLSTGVITNYNAQGNLRVNVTFDIDASNDISKARQVVLDVISTVPEVITTPAPSVLVAKVANSAISLAIGASATQADYWKVFFDLQEKIKIAFDQNGIIFPVSSLVVKQV